MIFARREGGLRVITQGDHAHFAAELLSLFRVPELVEHPRREGLLRAIREHDNGWRELDAAPPIEPTTGAPLGFRDIADELRRELWERGCSRLAGDDPYAALLITSHAIELHRDRRGSHPWTEWLDDRRTEWQELLEATSLTAAEAEADYLWLRLADACSLSLCEGRDSRSVIDGRLVTTRGTTLGLEPFPLAGTTTFKVACRAVERARFANDADLGRALAISVWGHQEFSIAPV